MKKNISTWVLIVLVAFCCLLTSCVQPPKPTELDKLTIPQLKENQMVVIVKIDNDSYKNCVVNLDDHKTADDVLMHLQQNEVLEIQFVDGDYGKYLTKIDALEQNEAAGKYISVYTSDSANQATWAGAIIYTVGSITIAPAKVGISELSVGSGTVLYFEIITY